MPSPTLNEKAPAATIRKGLDLISTTTRPIPGKDNRDAYVHQPAVRV